MILAKPKRQFRLVVERKEKAILGALESVSFAKQRAKKIQFDHVAGLYNASQFCMICELDLSILHFDLYMANTPWRKKLYARLLAMTLVECVEDITQLLGKEFRQNLDKAITKNDYKQKLNPIVKALTEFKKKHERNFRDIRNIAVAHRDQNAERQLVTINKIDPKMLGNLSLEFMGLLLPFTTMMTEFMNDMSAELKRVSKVINSAFPDAK